MRSSLAKKATQICLQRTLPLFPRHFSRRVNVCSGRNKEHAGTPLLLIHLPDIVMHALVLFLQVGYREHPEERHQAERAAEAVSLSHHCGSIVAPRRDAIAQRSGSGLTYQDPRNDRQNESLHGFSSCRPRICMETRRKYFLYIASKRFAVTSHSCTRSFRNFASASCLM